MAKIEHIKNKKHEIINPITTQEAVEGLRETLAEKQETLVSGENIRKINGESILGSGEIKITGGGPGSTIVVDGEMSTESENPVQNKVITRALESKQDELESGVNIKTVNGESIVGEGDLFIQEGDPSAVKFSPQELTESQKEQARRNIDAVSLSEVNNMEFVVASTLPEASADTLGYIFLIGPDEYDNYDRYFTQESEGAYSWISLGSTQIDLSTYATKAEVAQLEHEVHNLSGKYYGVFTDESGLPDDADTPGYAFVGATNPYAIWNFDGEEWSNSGAVANGIQGEPGVGFSSIFTPQPYDGTMIIVLSNSDTITVNLNHEHSIYPKYQLCEDEAEYIAIASKDPATLYLIPE